MFTDELVAGSFSDMKLSQKAVKKVLLSTQPWYTPFTLFGSAAGNKVP
jgi:hypothetical protein